MEAAPSAQCVKWVIDVDPAITVLRFFFWPIPRVIHMVGHYPMTVKSRNSSAVPVKSLRPPAIAQGLKAGA
jgi:hypothetical protein